MMLSTSVNNLQPPDPVEKILEETGKEDVSLPSISPSGLLVLKKKTENPQGHANKNVCGNKTMRKNWVKLPSVSFIKVSEEWKQEKEVLLKAAYKLKH